MKIVLLTLFIIVVVLPAVCLSAPVLNYTDVFVKNEDGFQCYRVPALLISSKGTILAFAEGRNGTTTPDTCSGDVGEQYKSLVLKRSFDQGQTWGAIQVVDTTDCGGGFECGYPAVIQDSYTGYIYVTFGGKPGVQITYSEDDGDTWTSFSSLPTFPSFTSTSPGHGIQIDGSFCGGTGPSCPDGRLVLPAECITNAVPHSCAIYSDDNGKTWTLSAPAQPYSKENQFVQLPSSSGDAILYSNERNFGTTKGVRLISRSTNGGTNFTDFSQDNTLIEPVTSDWTGVVASVVRLSSSPSVILFSDPASPTSRTNFTIRASFDEASSWPVSKVLDPGPSAYSDLGKISSTTAGVIYERGEALEIYSHITFVSFDLDWLQN